MIVAHVLLWLTTAALIANTARKLRQPLDVGLVVPLGWVLLMPLPIIVRGDALGFHGTPRFNLEVATSMANLMFLGLQFFLSSSWFARLSTALMDRFPSPTRGGRQGGAPQPWARAWVLALAIVATGLAVVHLALMPKIPLLEVIQGMTNPHQLALDRENSAKLLSAPPLLKYAFTWNSRVFFPVVVSTAILLRWWKLAIPVAIIGLFYVMSPLEKFPSVLLVLTPFLALAVQQGKRVYSALVIGGLLISLMAALLVLDSPPISNSVHHLQHLGQPAGTATAATASAPAPTSATTAPGASVSTAVHGLADLVLRRISTGPADVTYEWFAYFPQAHGGFLYGSGWAPWEVLSSTRQSPANMVGRWAYFGKPNYDIASLSAYASFIADGWAEFGYFGVALACLALFALAVVIEVGRLFVNEPLCLSCYVVALVLLAATVPSGGLLAIAFSLGTVLCPLISFAYLLTGRVWNGRRPVPATRPDQSASAIA